MSFARIIGAVVLLCLVRGAIAQEPAATAVSPSTASTTTPATAPAAVFDASDIPEHSDQSLSSMRDIDAKLSTDPIIQTVEENLGPLTVAILNSQNENATLLAPGTSLETLRAEQARWEQYRDQLGDWLRDLYKRKSVLNAAYIAQRKDREYWTKALDAARRAEANPEIVGRIRSIGDQLDRQAQRIVGEMVREQTFQDRTWVQWFRVKDGLDSVQEAADRAWSRLLQQDNPPLWSALLSRHGTGNITEESRNTFTNQWATLNLYVRQNQPKFLIHAAVMMLIAAALIWMRKQSRRLTNTDPAFHNALTILQMPIAVAIVATIIFSPWIYTQAPRLFWALFGITALVPTIYVLRRLVERSLIPLFYALAVWCVISLAISITASMPTVSRVIFVAQMTGGVLFFAWFLRSIRLQQAADENRKFWRIIRIGTRIAMAVTAVSALANLFGFVSFSWLLGRAIFTGAYLCVLLDATVRVVEAMMLGASYIYPLEGLGMVRRHRDVVLRRARGIVIIAAVFLWGYLTLESVSLRQGFVDHVSAILNAPWESIQLPGISLAKILHFLAVVAAAFMLARFIGFLLDEDIYPRLQLARGVPYAISTLVHYFILFFGFVLAVGGYQDLTQVTILVSAFGVGLGFGMQNIVNNFVSGLILLFERPVQVGDVIEVEGLTGIVSRIGIRASVIRTHTAAEIIVPNGNLISSRVVNWTLSNRQRGGEIPVTISAEAEPKHVIETLIRIAKAHPLVAASPTPQAYFIEFVPGGMKFELRVWTNRYEDWTRLRSDLSIAIHETAGSERLQIK